MTARQDSSKRHRVVIVGAGFGGLWAVKHLKGAPVDIILIDQRNHHLFQPLLYQVATAALAPSEIAWPIRSMLHDRKDVTTILAAVVGIDVPSRAVRLADGATVPYDTLILATGARHGYFGHDEWEKLAPGLKTIEDATAIRGSILTAFEQAERETDPVRRQALLTFAIVGGGPTGVELAGTIADLAPVAPPLTADDREPVWIDLQCAPQPVCDIHSSPPLMRFPCEAVCPPSLQPERLLCALLSCALMSFALLFWRCPR